MNRSAEDADYVDIRFCDYDDEGKVPYIGETSTQALPQPMYSQLSPSDGFGKMSSLQTAMLPLQNFDVGQLDVSFWYAFLGDHMATAKSIGLDKRTVVELVKG